LAADITSLIISTKSEGIQASTKDLNELVKAADSAAKSTDKLKNSGKQQADSQKSTTSALENALLAMKKQVDLLGASVAKINSYNASLKGADAAQLAMASSLGRQVDNYRALSVAQTAAIRDNNALDASNKKLAASQRLAQTAGNNLNELGQRTQAYQRLSAAQAEALRINAALNRSQNSGSNLNLSGQRAEDFRKLASAQQEAIRMNNAFNASIERQKLIMQSRDIDRHRLSVQQYTQSHAEAIRMNNIHDAAARRLADGVRVNTNNIRNNNDVMKEAQALARGLSGSLGALWLTYGNFIGMAAGLAIGFSLKGIVTVGADVENTLEGIRVRGTETIASVAEVREAVLKIGDGVYGPQEVAKAFEALTLAGLKVAESTLAIGSALNLALVGGTSIEKAAESLVSIGTAVGATAKSFDYLADGIVAAANTSLASVDSISASVKRASIVNKLYGASFEDILTQTAALAQLGIKNTAAGTAITNFYNNAVGNTGKSRKALDQLGMSFTDATGKAKPLVAAFEEFSEKLNKYDLKSQQNFINDIFGERALRDVEGLRDAVNSSATDTEKYSNRLREIQGQIADSAGASSLEAVQLGLTTQKSLSSIANTLRVSFTEVFTELAPSLLVISARLREAFASDEFKGGLSNIANGISNVALAIVNNIGVLGNLIELFIVFKAATIGASLFEGIAKGVLGIATAMGFVTVATNGAVIATGALRIAMLAIPIIGLAVTALSIGLALAAFHTNEVKDNSQALADTYNKDFLKALEDEAKRLKKSNDLMLEGVSATDAATRSLKELALEKSRQINTDNVARAQTTFDSAKAATTSTAYILKTVDYTFDSKNSKETLALAEATEALNIARKAANDFDTEALRLTEEIVAGSKLKGELYKKDQKDREAAAKADAGTLIYDRTKEDTKGINDSYRAAQVSIDSQIKKAKQGMQDFEDLQNDRFKAGEIGKLALIRDIGAQQIEAYDKIAKELAAKRIVAQGGKNKKADLERIDGLAEANTEALAQANRKVASETNVELARLEHDSTKYYISELEARGEFSKAASEKFSSEYSMAIKQVTADFDKFGYAIPAVAYAMDSLNKAKKAVMATAEVKEATAEFEKQNAVIVNLFKGVQTASEGQGMAAMYEAASAAAETYRQKLPALIQAQKDLSEKATLSGNPNDLKLSEEALTKIKADAEHLKTMFAGVGESISKSLESAFGKAGKSVGELLKAGTKYSELTDKSGAANIKTYGDMAGAAKGFFDEGTTGYKLMSGAEKAFRLLELAGLAESLYTSLFVTTAKATGAVSGQAVETAAVATGETARNAIKVPGVFMAFMSSLGPFGMAAAGIAIAAVLGGAFSGGGNGALEAAQQAQKDRIANQGTGTVFGDTTAKSASIGKSIELIAKYTYENLDFSSKMLTTMRSIAESLTGVSKSLLLTVGLTSGSAFGTTEKAMGSGILSSLFGSSSRNITGSGININGSIGQLANGGGSATGYENVTTTKSGALFGLFGGGSSNSTKNFELGADFKEAISKAYSSVRAGIIEVGTQLGLGADDLATKLSAIQSKVTVETRGLKGKELTDAVEAVFSAEMDRISALTLSLVKEYNVAGEGMLETAVRVANTSRVIDMQLLSAGDTFGAVGASSLRMRMSLVGLAGGLDEFVKKSDFFKDNFLSEAERMAPITKKLSEEMARLNISSITTNEAFKNLVLAQDKSTPAGQAMYVALLNIQGAFYKSTEFAGKLALATTSVTNAQQLALDLISKRRTQLQTSYDSEKSSLQSVIDKMKTFSEGMKSFKESLTIGADSPFTNAEKYARAFAKFNDVSVLAKSGDASAQAEFQTVSNNLLAASKIYNASGNQYMTDFNRVLTETQALADSSSGQVSVAQASLDALTASVTGLLDINKSVMSVTDAIAELRFAITGGYAEGLTKSQVGIDGSHANGLMNVPFDGYIAELHKGEQVLTAPQAINYRSMGTMDMAPLVAEIKSLREELCSLRADQDTQTRASIQATYDASGKNASSVVNGIDNSLSKVSTKATITLN
jgi:TP901 family phage tail tape measure protein